MWIRRVGATNARVTQHRIYKVGENGRIKDDKGTPMKPCTEIEGYWEEVVGYCEGVNLSKWPDTPISKADTTKRPHNDMFQPENIDADREYWKKVWWSGCKQSFETFILDHSKPITGEFKMKETSKTVVETVTLINDQRADNYFIHEILNLIEKEEKKLARLEGVQAKSKAIDKLKTQHQETIAALVAVLDSRE